MKHAFNLVPLSPVGNKGRIRTLCKASARPGDIATPENGHVLSCFFCLKSATELYATYLAILNTLPNGTEGHVQIARLLDRLAKLMGQDDKSVWHFKHSETWANRTFYVQQRADRAFWAWGFAPEERSKDLYLSSGDAARAAKAAIDAALQEEQDHGRDD